MTAFRYRTTTLLGSWRNSEDAAVLDAIRAKQARHDEEGAGWHWVVPGSIEERQEAHLHSRNDNFDFVPVRRQIAR